MKIDITTDDGTIYSGALVDCSFSERSSQNEIDFSGTIWNLSKTTNMPGPTTIERVQDSKPVTVSELRRAITFED